MMNEEARQFEQRLSQQPVKKLPGEWRAEILAAARAAQPAPVVRGAKPSLLATINGHLVALLWPHPKAWAGLAAVWVGIIALNTSMQEKGPSPLAEKASPPSPEAVAELQKEHRLYAELMGWNGPRDVDRPKVSTPSPRSGRTELWVG